MLVVAGNRQHDAELGPDADSTFYFEATLMRINDVQAGAKASPVPPLPLSSGPAFVL